MNDKTVLVIDHTIREGMQYRGVMFSLQERKQILEFQEKLGIDISQVAYPPAHISEVSHLQHLHGYSKEKGFHVRIAGLCRAIVEDVRWMADLGLTEFHLHSGVNKSMLNRFGPDEIFRDLRQTVQFLKRTVAHPCISVAFADIGQTDLHLLKQFVDFAADGLEVDIVNLPDTSGTLAPNVYHDIIAQIALRLENKPARICVHCHNDMGMATANTIMGVIAGASVIEASALGIGERNGIADLFSTCRALKDQGYDISVNTGDIDGFKAYYEYIQQLCINKTGFGPLNYNTPVFGDAVKTHVAGTHDIIHYGMTDEKKFALNVLCGKHMVRSYLDQSGIAYDPGKIESIVSHIKDQSAAENRGLTRNDVRLIVEEIG